MKRLPYLAQPLFYVIDAVDTVIFCVQPLLACQSPNFYRNISAAHSLPQQGKLLLYCSSPSLFFRLFYVSCCAGCRHRLRRLCCIGILKIWSMMAHTSQSVTNGSIKTRSRRLPMRRQWPQKTSVFPTMSALISTPLSHPLINIGKAAN